jgi:hypothetical protein
MKAKRTKAKEKSLTARRRARLALGCPKPAAVEVPKPRRAPKHKKPLREEDSG